MPPNNSREYRPRRRYQSGCVRTLPHPLTAAVENLKSPLLNLPWDILQRIFDFVLTPSTDEPIVDPFMGVSLRSRYTRASGVRLSEACAVFRFSPEIFRLRPLLFTRNRFCFTSSWRLETFLHSMIRRGCDPAWVHDIEVEGDYEYGLFLHRNFLAWNALFFREWGVPYLALGLKCLRLDMKMGPDTLLQEMESGNSMKQTVERIEGLERIVVIGLSAQWWNPLRPWWHLRHPSVFLEQFEHRCAYLGIINGMEGAVVGSPLEKLVRWRIIDGIVEVEVVSEIYISKIEPNWRQNPQRDDDPETGSGYRAFIEYTNYWILEA